MSKARKKQKQRQQALKRWRKRVPEAVSPLRPVSFKAADRMAREHLDVLQNIEFVLAQHYQEHERVDDVVVHQALVAALLQTDPDDPDAARVVEGLAEIRLIRSDISDSVWQQALRIVLSSVRRHSRMRAGSTEYLDFIAQFL